VRLTALDRLARGAGLTRGRGGGRPAALPARSLRAPRFRSIGRASNGVPRSALGARAGGTDIWYTDCDGDIRPLVPALDTGAKFYDSTNMDQKDVAQLLCD
jgi:hypothetical protein